MPHKMFLIFTYTFVVISSLSNISTITRQKPAEALEYHCKFKGTANCKVVPLLH
jgi:hypothetical protein